MSRLWRVISAACVTLGAGAVGVHLWSSPLGAEAKLWLYVALGLLGAGVGVSLWSWRPASAAPELEAPLEPPARDAAPDPALARALIEALPSAALLVGPELEIVSCQAEVAQRLHLRADGRGDLRDAAPRTEAGQALLAAVGRCLRQGAAELEWGADGSGQRAALRAIPWGERRAALLWLEGAAGNDGEARDEAVQALKNQNLTLQEHNAALCNSQELLTDQNQRLKAQDKSKSDLLANVSHDLRTPLVSIRGYTEMLMRGDLGPVTEQQRRGMATSLRNLDKLLGLVSDLLNFDELSQGEASLKLEELELRQLVGDIVELFGPNASERGVRLELRGDAGALWVEGDRIKLHQVLSNLVSNALKFTEAGGEVRVEARGASRGERAQVEGQLEAAREAAARGPTTLEGSRRGRWVLLRVSDTGRGMSREHLSRIFDRRYSAHPGQNEGLGLGLSITDQIVRNHGGMIEVSSAEGEGSIFTVWLPIGTREVLEASARGRQVSGPLRATTPTGGVLVVDDDPDIQEMVRLVLESEGFAVEVASGEREMLGVLARSAPGLVLMDYTLEGSASGHEILARLKAEPGTRALPVVMLTGRTDAAVRAACLEAGAVGFLAKPFGVEELLEVAGEHLERARVESPGRG